MIHTDSRWTFTQEHMDNLRQTQKTSGSFDSALIDAWFKASSGNKKQLERAFMFLSDPKNIVTEQEFHESKNYGRV